jgi:HEPN domain-containing protein
MSHAAWLVQAESDLEAGKLLSANGYHSQAVWLAAQAVEKAHKAILFALGLRVSEELLRQLSHKISQVADLLPESLQEPRNPLVSEAISALQLLATTSRYPTPATPVRPKQAPQPAVAPAMRIAASQAELADADMLVTWCRERITRALEAAQTMGSSPAPSSPSISDDERDLICAALDREAQIGDESASASAGGPAAEGFQDRASRAREIVAKLRAAPST